VQVLGLDPQAEAQALKRRIGSQLQQSALPDRIKVWEALDLLTKAQQFATLTGVQLGKLLFISETSGAVPLYQDVYRGLAQGVTAAPVTPISGGQLEIRLGVQAVFDIG
jgi:uncharacterized protein YggE